MSAGGGNSGGGSQRSGTEYRPMIPGAHRTASQIRLDPSALDAMSQLRTTGAAASAAVAGGGRIGPPTFPLSQLPPSPSASSPKRALSDEQLQAFQRVVRSRSAMVTLPPQEPTGQPSRLRGATSPGMPPIHMNMPRLTNPNPNPSVRFGGNPSGNLVPRAGPNSQQTLVKLEQQLLGDDDAAAASSSGRPVGPIKTDWTDVLEELLSNSPPASSTITVEQQTVTSCSSGSVSDATPTAPPPTGHFPASTRQTSNGNVTKAEEEEEVMASPRELLVACATAISENNLEHAERLLLKLKPMASIYGDPMQRLTAHVSDALLTRIQQSMKGLHGKAVQSKQPSPLEIIGSKQVLYRVSPYYKFGYMAANSAIIEALKGEDKVHIIDFDIGQGNQWLAMIKAFAARPGGPPQLRITGIAGPSLHFYKGGLQMIGKRLENLAETLGMRFEFTPIETEASELQEGMLESREGEALVTNMAFQLHRVPDESVSIENPRDKLLRMVRALQPRVLTLVELEANTNTAPFLPRFVETLDRHTALFESLEAALPRDSDRAGIEAHCLARTMLDAIACEGPDRIERYEWLRKWRARMGMAGFRPSPLSRIVTHSIRMLVDKYQSKYFVKEEDGALYLGWQDTLLVAASAWRP